MYAVASGGAVVRLTLVAKEVVFCKGSQGCVVCKEVAQVVGVRPLVLFMICGSQVVYSPQCSLFYSWVKIL